MFERVHNQAHERRARDKNYSRKQARCYVRKPRTKPRNENRNKRSRFECLIIILIERNKEYEKIEKSQ